MQALLLAQAPFEINNSMNTRFASRPGFHLGLVGLVFLACATLLLAVGCGGGGGADDSAPRGPVSAPLTLEVELDRGDQDEGIIIVTATLADPAPSGGTTVMISIVVNLEGGGTVERDENITIAEGGTTKTETFTVTDPTITPTVRTVVVNATSTNPSLRAPIIEIDLRGGGNGPSTGPAAPTRPNPVNLEFRSEQLGSPNASDGRNYRDAEFMTHYGLAAISADGAYSRGYFGQGVTIAVADNGMDITHPDLAVAGKITAPRHIRNRNAVVREPSKVSAPGHGTYVALLAAGAADNTGGTFQITLDGGNPIPTENVHGVAPRASVMPIAMEGGGNPVDAMRYAVENGAQVLNLSIGTPLSLYGKLDNRDGVWLTLGRPHFRPLLSLDLGRHTSGLTGEFAKVAEILEDQDIVFVWASGNEDWNSESGSPVGMCGKNFIGEDGCLLGDISVTQQEFMENFRWIYDEDNLGDTVSFKDMWGTDCGESNCVEYNSPGGWMEAPLFEPGLLGKWLVVGASDENGRITDFSNGCGAARNWCLVAPGQYLTVTPAEPRGISGTSFAAPIVSGALAVLKSRFPDMPMEVIQAILLVSADPVGTRENDPENPDPVYGWGLLNLENAVLQQGMVRLPYSSPGMLGATRGRISPENYRPAPVSSFVLASEGGQDRNLRRGQCVSPYEIIRRYRNRN